MYYADVNDGLQEFRHAHGLSPAEFVVFLYDFAPGVIRAEQDPELPPPTRVWLTKGGIGGNRDFETVDAADSSTIATWQGNIETRRGDIILMRCVSPRAYLHSLWRAVDNGFADPFFSYYGTIRFGSCIKVPPVPFREFAADKILSTN